MNDARSDRRSPAERRGKKLMSLLPVIDGSGNGATVVVWVAPGEEVSRFGASSSDVTAMATTRYTTLNAP